eukprot:Blabericola_migrator_1__13251@NODE_922_length_6035_cov_55_172587_g641_i0_p3_GENE_NODE_922_length_6035_cov_55_172587_g641_i0NODE_922_length_6035_cov_55_172587_g641_i0_p3_ORF_typecomplete_len386_score46_90Fbox/PF00646_33/0_34_NODE_922_length_6035_cov_55_172587_g641_i0831240
MFEVWIHIQPFLTHRCLIKFSRLSKAFREWITQDAMEIVFKNDCFKRTLGFYHGHVTPEWLGREGPSGFTPRTWLEANAMLEMEETACVDSLPEIVSLCDVSYQRVPSPPLVAAPLWKLRHIAMMSHPASRYKTLERPVYERHFRTPYLECGFYESNGEPTHSAVLVMQEVEESPVDTDSVYRGILKVTPTPYALTAVLNRALMQDPMISATPATHMLPRLCLESMSHCIMRDESSLMAEVNPPGGICPLDTFMRGVKKGHLDSSLCKARNQVWHTRAYWPGTLHLNADEVLNLNAPVPCVKSVETGAGLYAGAKVLVETLVRVPGLEVARIIKEFLGKDKPVECRVLTANGNIVPSNTVGFFAGNKGVIMFSYWAPFCGRLWRR